jgi:hypothetical protein
MRVRQRVRMMRRILELKSSGQGDARRDGQRPFGPAGENRILGANRGISKRQKEKAKKKEKGKKMHELEREEEETWIQ